ncbi:MULTISPECIES: phosphatidate cytidylyltransferase [Micromonospora]|uniref:Phosphatidate cytidylyltransferase n=1 Tax=Micromonospora solifontis TaxID=2487138 RepID=A0ABX9WLT4_9ACTN|nr:MULTISPECIES: phosphatidate cytidylyltransferase [Micromonospora]NES16115.1 phosphatidate cytidylyltransferase [Micromonospora sp. PPF5-17B]NES34897.1 phosphatidate cytidylyltransferase [Micromonospora solifontis]NES57615.1 phosphatidate cytidylyltransferase [Micromonospora sp. PPF5-6]RNM01463.1 phosphatidate cytidylyltransferase [Micromonospora solifontis]
MSHPEPYGTTEPRGWDRPERPLPWPETDIEPGPWQRSGGAEAYAGPYGRPQPTADPYGRPGDGYAGPRDRGPYDEFPASGRRDDARSRERGPRDADRAYAGHRGPRDRGYDPGHDDPRDRGYDPGPRERDLDPGYAVDRRDRGYGPGPHDRGHEDSRDLGHRLDPRGGDDEYPTAQIAPVRDEPTAQLAAVPGEPDPEPPAGRRTRGRRRASADRPPTVQAASGRAGRNLPAAIGVGLALGAAIVVPLFFYLPAFLAVIAAAVAIGVWEMARAVRRSGAHPPLVPLIAGGVITVGLGWFAGPDALSLGLLVTVLGTMIWRLGDGPGNYQRDLTAATLIAVYVPFLGGFAAMLAAAPGDGHLRVLVTLVAVVLSDTGGYAAGVAFGKHPMAPTISPKKSWEGFAGSVTAAAAGSALLLWLLLDVVPWWGALFGVAISCAAVLGDLAESMIKRDLGVKDMSNLLPGHGGLMDRLDSILFAVPTAYLLLAVFVPSAG